MTSFALTSPRPWYFHIPVFGWIAHDLLHGDEDNIYYFLVIVLTLLVLAFRIWGLLALGLASLAMVPVIFTVLILITLGK